MNDIFNQMPNITNKIFRMVSLTARYDKNKEKVPL